MQVPDDAAFYATENQSETYIAALQDPTDLQVRKNELLNLIDRIYGPDSAKKDRVRKIRHSRRIGSGSVNYITGEKTGFAVSDNFESCQRRIHGLIDAFVKELQDFGLPGREKRKTEDGITITVNQNQTVNVNAVLETVQQELAEHQLRELKEILSGEEAPKEKREKVASKVKSFGSDVAANVMAGVLTNPQILGLF